MIDSLSVSLTSKDHAGFLLLGLKQCMKYGCVNSKSCVKFFNDDLNWHDVDVPLTDNSRLLMLLLLLLVELAVVLSLRSMLMPIADDHWSAFLANDADEASSNNFNSLEIVSMFPSKKYQQNT